MRLNTFFFYWLHLLLLLASQTNISFAYETQGRRGSDHIEDRRGEEADAMNLGVTENISVQYQKPDIKRQNQKADSRKKVVNAKNLANFFYTNCIRSEQNLLGNEQDTVATMDVLRKMLSLSFQFNRQPTFSPEVKTGSSSYRSELLARKMFFCIDKRIDETLPSEKERKDLKSLLYLLMTLELKKDEVRKLQKSYLFGEESAIISPQINSVPRKNAPPPTQQ